jgi:hypothetical protein
MEDFESVTVLPQRSLAERRSNASSSRAAAPQWGPEPLAVVTQQVVYGEKLRFVKFVKTAGSGDYP